MPILAVLLVLALSPLTGVAGLAAPAPPKHEIATRFDVPGWMSAETAQQLDLGFDVLVPADVPSPFDGEPAVEAYDGYYQLYWLIAGAPPTYLLISGEVGGTIPDFSYYDRNVQLEVNADVQGTPAYHDLTPIYDRVYWQVGDVVYTVDSHNLDSTDSLTLANSLFPLGGTPPTDTGNGTGGGPDTGNDTGGNNTGNQGGNGTQSPQAALDVSGTVGSGETLSVSVSGVADATLSADAGAFASNGESTLQGVGDGSYDWQAPAPDAEQTVTFTLADGDSGETLATAQTVVQAAPPTAVPTEATLKCPVLATAGKEATISVAGSGTVTVDASDGTFPAESPNTDFAPDADGSDVLNGTLPEKGTVSLTWLAPDAEMTAYFFVYDADGNTIADCGTDVTFDEVATGDATPTATATPKRSGPPGDGTQLGKRFDAVVTQVLAYKSPPTGDATGAPKAAEVPPTAEAPPDATATPTPAPTKTPKPTATATATLAPVSLSEGGVAQTIGPGGGELQCPLASGATLSIPAGALKEPSWVTIRPLGDREVPTSSSVTLVDGTAYDVTVALANGESVDKLAAPATLTISVPKRSTDRRLMLYRVSGTRLEPLSGVKVEGDTISAQLSNASKVVAGLPAPSAPAATTRDPMPFILAALGIVVALMAVFAVAGVVLRRRPRTVTPRRGIPSRARVR
ncbi:MAG TPA: hypothetical protein VH482_31390 [Thermomicrobiales bacterium]|jgi:hypothetical protein